MIYTFFILLINQHNCVYDVMVSVPASSTVDIGFEPVSGQTNDYKINIYCNSAYHATLRSKNKLVSSEIGDVHVEQHVCLQTVVSMSKHYKNPTKCVGLVQSGHLPIECNLFLQ